MVAWSTDGSKLFAASNRVDAAGRTSVHTWLNGGWGAHSDKALARGAIYGLVGVSKSDGAPTSDVAYASAEPSWGVLHADGIVDPVQAPATVDYGDAVEDFRLAPDGKAVQFDVLERRPATSAQASHPGMGGTGAEAPASCCRNGRCR